MSALGEYIHYYTKNYLEYGTARNGDYKGVPAEVSLQLQKEKITQNINNLPTVNEKVLDKVREKIFNDSDAKTAEAVARLDTGYKAGIEVLTGKMEKVVSNLAVNNTSVDNSKVAKLAEQLQANFGANLKEGNIIGAAKQRKKLLDHIWSFNQGYKSVTLETIYNDYVQFFKDIHTNEQTVAQLMPSVASLEDQGTQAALLTLVKALPLKTGTEGLYHGAFAEALVASLNYSLGNVTAEALYDSIQEGQTRQSFQLSKDAMLKSVLSEFQDIQKKKDVSVNGKKVFAVYATQQKVDVTLNLDEDTQLATSIKGYKIGDGGNVKAGLQTIHLLYTLAATETSFANHWLNRHALGIDANSFDEVLKDTLRYEALVTGNPLKQPQEFADTFIWIDPNIGKVYVNSAKNMLNNQKDKFSITGLDKIDFNNDWSEEGAAKRIALLLNHVHAQKIKVSYKISKDMMSEKSSYV
jgi:hypothetical protein